MGLVFDQRHQVIINEHFFSICIMKTEVMNKTRRNAGRWVPTFFVRSAGGRQKIKTAKERGVITGLNGRYQIFIENLFHSLFFPSFSSSSSLRQSTLISLINAFSFRNSKILRAFFLILFFNFHPVTRFLCREKMQRIIPWRPPGALL